MMAMAPCAASSSVSFPARTAASATPAVRPGATGSVRAHAVAERAGGKKWWAPLLGLSRRADYVEAPAPAPARDDPAAAASRRQFMGGLTEEKARDLSARMWVTDCFHDAMYHSAVASHLGRSR